MNPDETEGTRWGLIDMESGEITPVAMIEDKPGRWDRVYGKALANMLEAGGEEKTRIIAYLIRNRDYKNVVMASIREIAEAANCSTKTVSRTLKALSDRNFIHRLRHGVIMFSPHVIRTGKDTAGLVVLRKWKDATQEVCDENSETDEADRRDGGSDSIPRIRSNRLSGRKLAASSAGSEALHAD